MAKSSKSKKNNIALVPQENDSNKPVATKIGSARGIESLFRSSYRTQLDMIALAATKANIMISLNGLLVSMLLLSGAYFLASDPLLLIPVCLFLLTCTTAIIFAVLAARPDINRDVPTIDDFKSDKAKLLVFDQFSSLSSDDYVEAMLEMMKDNDRVYSNMTSHLHTLGCIADKKFTRLYISYNAFIIGLVISVVSLILVVATQASSAI